MDNYFKKELSNIFDVAERYGFVRDTLSHLYHFMAPVYDLSISEFDFIIDSVHFGRSEIFKNLDSSGFFRGKENKDELFGLEEKGYVEIDVKNESEDNYFYSYIHTEKAKKLYDDFTSRVSQILDKRGYGIEAVGKAYDDVIEKLDVLFYDMRLVSADSLLFKIENPIDGDSDFNRRFSLARDIKKALYKKYPYVYILSLLEYDQMREDYREATENPFFDADDKRHILEIEFMYKGRRTKRILLVNIDDYEDIIDIGPGFEDDESFDDEDMDFLELADNYSYYDFLTHIKDLNTSHKMMKDRLRNLFSFLSPVYDLTLGEFEFILYYENDPLAQEYGEYIDYIDGYFIDDRKKIIESLVEKGFLDFDGENYETTEKSSELSSFIENIYNDTIRAAGFADKEIIDDINKAFKLSDRLGKLYDSVFYKFILGHHVTENNILGDACKKKLSQYYENPSIKKILFDDNYIQMEFSHDKDGQKITDIARIKKADTDDVQILLGNVDTDDL